MSQAVMRRTQVAFHTSVAMSYERVSAGRSELPPSWIVAFPSYIERLMQTLFRLIAPCC